MARKSRKQKKSEKLRKQDQRRRGKPPSHTLPHVPSKHYFHLKGLKAEELLHELAEKTFLEDWCYKNPLLPNGKELCDLLVVFDDVAIIWQLKDVKLAETGNFREKDMQKNLRQLAGAHRQLFELKQKVMLSNPRRGQELFDPSRIKEIFLISALFREQPFITRFTEKVSGHAVHIFTKAFTEIALNELDTISDFSAYLRAKESTLHGNVRCIVTGGEEELLAYYIRNSRSFDKLTSCDVAMFHGGDWEDLQANSQYKARQELDAVSYLWDGIIDRAHEGNNPQYEIIARELARCTRFERRILSKAFLEAHLIAHNSRRTFRRFYIGEDAVYCFLFQDDPEPREDRKAHLAAMCHVARGRYRDRKIIGIATEQIVRPTSSYDFALFMVHEWTAEDQRILEQIESKGDILRDPKKVNIHEDEYPA